MSAKNEWPLPGELYKLASLELVYPEHRPVRTPVRKPTIDTMSTDNRQAIIHRAFAVYPYQMYAS
ncbi:hypothetical protein [Spirosoma flavus]